MAIAGAVLHQLATHALPLCCFATHYSSLTDDYAYHPNIRNMHMGTIMNEEEREVRLLCIVYISYPWPGTYLFFIYGPCGCFWPCLSSIVYPRDARNRPGSIACIHIQTRGRSRGLILRNSRRLARRRPSNHREASRSRLQRLCETIQRKTRGETPNNVKGSFSDSGWFCIPLQNEFGYEWVWRCRQASTSAEAAWAKRKSFSSN